MTPAKPSALLNRIRKLVEDREDCTICASPITTAELLIFQVRRVQRFESIGDGPFTKYEKTSWFYFSQPIFVDTRVKEKLTPAQIDTRELMKMMGIVWLPMRDIKELHDELGKVQDWTRETARPERIA